MRFFKTVISYLGSCYYFVRERMNPSRIREGREVPIIINNFNRLDTLCKLLDALVVRGYTNIYILDN